MKNCKNGAVFRSLLVYPREYPVERGEGEIEPAVGAHFLASVAQDEVAVFAFLERQSDVHEEYVAEFVLVGVADGSPYGGRGGLKGGVALAFRGQVP